MIDRTIMYRLIGAGIMVLSAAIILPLILDGERPAELDVQVNVTEPPAFPVVKIEPVQSVASMSANPVNAEVIEPKLAQEISLLPERKKVTESMVAMKGAEPKQETKKEPIQKTVVPAERWTVQIASFKSKENATSLVAKLKEANYDVYSITTNSLYKVYVGPEFKREASEATREEIKKKFNFNAIVVKFSVN